MSFDALPGQREKVDLIGPVVQGAQSLVEEGGEIIDSIEHPFKTNDQERP
jgi:hypothetical protein